MIGICPVCGQDNTDDVLRCPCEHETQEMSGSEGKKIPPSMNSAQLHIITNCPECNSQNIEKYNSNKRGTILTLLAAISFILPFVVNDGGDILYLTVTFLYAGLRLLYKNKNYIICKDCLYSNYK